MGQYLSGREAMEKAAAGFPIQWTEEGLVVYPEEKKDMGKHSSGYGKNIPVFFPSGPEEAAKMSYSAGIFAETYRVPVLVRGERETAESSADVLIPQKRKTRYIPEKKNRENLTDGRKKEADKKADYPGFIPSRAMSDSEWNRMSGSGEKAVLTAGTAWAHVMDILNGYDRMKVIKIGTVNPFPEEAVCAFLKGIREVLVLDQKETGASLPEKLYMIKGKYNLRVSITDGTSFSKTDEQISRALIRFAGEKGCILTGAPPAERSLAQIPFLPDRAGENSEIIYLPAEADLKEENKECRIS